VLGDELLEQVKVPEMHDVVWQADNVNAIVLLYA
jgi:hypothetical protein